MEFRTFDQWSDETWAKVSPIYEKAFAGKGAKPEKIIRHMFRKKLCFLHVGFHEGEAVSMALTGALEGAGVLLIDYLAVDESLQNRGIGRGMVELIKDWCVTSGRFTGIVIEAEAEVTPENQARIDFWKKCGFTLTEYVHHYIWVPETYRAMFINLVPDTGLPENGEELFRYIGRFHKASFQGV